MSNAPVQHTLLDPDADARVTDPRGTRRPRRYLVTVVAVVALLTTGWLVGRNGPSSAVPGRDVTVVPSPLPPVESGAGLDVTWQDLAGIEVPVSVSAGPHVLDDGRARGFEQTDRGAAFAAVHLMIRTFPVVGPSVFGQTIAQQVDGKDAKALARLTLQAYDDAAQATGVPDGDPLRGADGWVAGYQFDGQPSATDADVRVLIRADAPDLDGFAEYRVHVTWRDGDWRLTAPAWGDWRNAARGLADPDPAEYRSYDQVNSV